VIELSALPEWPKYKADFSKYAMICSAAILSSSFDATDRLDIGLYDLTSPEC